MLSIALANNSTKARSLHHSDCSMKFQTVPTYIWDVAHIRHRTNLEVSYQIIILINHANLTQHIWSLKHFLEFTSAECSFTKISLKPVQSLEFWMFYQIFLSLQAKRCAIITYKHGIYELPHGLPNGLRILRKT